jgi:putative transposase
MRPRRLPEKRQDLEERFGVTTLEVNAAYSSQQCSRCGFTSRDNRPVRASFRCARCGHTSHADVDAARVLRARRSSPFFADPYRSRRQVLAELKRRGLHADAAATAGQRQAGDVTGVVRRSAQRGWSGDPWDAGFHAPGPAGSALRDAAPLHLDGRSRTQ